MKKRSIAFLLAAGLICTSVCGSSKSAPMQAKEFEETGKLWVIGDSISSDHNDEDNLRENKKPITGWGNVLQNFVSDDVIIENNARSGRSSQSYTREKVYKDVKKGVSAGDYVIIQFGHNDEKADNKGLYTDPAGDTQTEGSFKNYLKNYYIDVFMEKGARVILASNVVRYNFDGDQLAEQSHEPYAIAMKELAEECQKADMEVYFIDTYQLTGDLYNELGAEDAKRLHAVLKQDPDTTLDTTHYGPYGAVYAADMVAGELKKLGLECFKDVETANIADSEAEQTARSNAEKFSWR